MGKPVFLSPYITNHILNCFLVCAFNEHSICCRVWAQMLDRSQRRIALVLVPLAYFVYDHEQMIPAEYAPLIIHEETSEVWINVSVVIY